MAYSNYVKALELLSQCEHFEEMGGQPLVVIEEAETLMDIKFSRQIKEFLADYGYISFCGHEVYGIIKDNFGDFHTLAGSMVQSNLSYRQDYGLPKEWVHIYDFGYDGYLGCLDHSQLNDEGEPPVIMVGYDGKQFFIAEKIEEDLGDFLLELVENCLKAI